MSLKTHCIFYSCLHTTTTLIAADNSPPSTTMQSIQSSCLKQACKRKPDDVQLASELLLLLMLLLLTADFSFQPWLSPTWHPHPQSRRPSAADIGRCVPRSTQCCSARRSYSPQSPSPWPRPPRSTTTRRGCCYCCCCCY